MGLWREGGVVGGVDGTRVGLWREGGVVGGVDGTRVGLWREGGVVGGVDGILEGGGSGRWSGWDSGGRGEW